MSVRGRLPSILLAVLALAYAAFWVVTLASPSFEGDAIRFLIGSVQTAKGFDQPLVYRYHNQPLYHIVLTALAHVFDARNAWWEVVPSTLSLIVILATCWDIARRLVGANAAWAFLATLALWHDLLVAGSYPNSTIMALAFACMSAWVLVRWDPAGRSGWTTTAVAAVLAVLALYSRNDAAFLVPALIVAILFRGGWKKGLSLLAVMGLLGLLLIPITGFRLAAALHSAESHRTGSGANHGLLYFMLMSAPLALWLCAAGGVVVLSVRRRFRTLMLIGTAILPSFLFYRQAMTTPKYLLYTWPFFAWLAMEGWEALVRLPRWATWTARILCGILLVGQLARPGIEDTFTADGNRPFMAVATFPLRESAKLKATNAEVYRQIAAYPSLIPERKTSWWLGYGQTLRFQLLSSIDAVSVERVAKMMAFTLSDGRQVIINVLLPSQFDAALKTAVELLPWHWVSVFDVISKQQEAQIRSSLPDVKVERRGRYFLLLPDPDTPEALWQGWTLSPRDTPTDVLTVHEGLVTLNATPNQFVQICQEHWLRPTGPVVVTGAMAADAVTYVPEPRPCGVIAILAQMKKDGTRVTTVVARAEGTQALHPVRERYDLGSDMDRVRLCLGIRAKEGQATFDEFRVDNE